jgi:hypothetical protein
MVSTIGRGLRKHGRSHPKIIRMVPTSSIAPPQCPRSADHSPSFGRHCFSARKPHPPFCRRRRSHQRQVLLLPIFRSPLTLPSTHRSSPPLPANPSMRFSTKSALRRTNGSYCLSGQCGFRLQSEGSRVSLRDKRRNKYPDFVDAGCWDWMPPPPFSEADGVGRSDRGVHWREDTEGELCHSPPLVVPSRC